MRHASQTDSVRPAPLCANRLGSGGRALGRSKKRMGRGGEQRDASAALRPARRRPTQSSHRISHRATETRCSGGGLHANKSSYISARWVASLRTAAGWAAAGTREEACQAVPKMARSQTASLPPCIGVPAAVLRALHGQLRQVASHGAMPRTPHHPTSTLDQSNTQAPKHPHSQSR